VSAKTKSFSGASELSGIEDGEVGADFEQPTVEVSRDFADLMRFSTSGAPNI